MTAEILGAFPAIESITLVPGSGGRFEVTLDGELLFSKIQSGRHADPGEVISRLRARL